MSKPYPQDLRDRAVRMVLETKHQYPSEHQAMKAMKAIAAMLGIGTTQTLTNWVRRAEIDAGTRPGVTTAEAEEIKALRREVAELRRANEILKAASAFFAAELDRPLRRS
ncbi:MAG: transposase [Catenulispora sp.]|nr:transposase [Catenulispora sp.]